MARTPWERGAGERSSTEETTRFASDADGGGTASGTLGRRDLVKALGTLAAGGLAATGQAGGARAADLGGGSLQFCPGVLEWDESFELSAFDGEADDRFGTDVSLDGHTGVIGAPNADPLGQDSGSAYVFRRWVNRIQGRSPIVRWIWQDELVPNDGDADDAFGTSVAVEGDRAVVGAPGDEHPNGAGAGAAYVFERSGWDWSQQAKLVPNDGDADDSFGESVAMDGGTVLVGASADDDPNGSVGGSAYVFTRSGGSWSQQAKLAAADGQSSARFGAAVAVDGDDAIVGAETEDVGDDVVTDEAGAAYVFTRSNGSWSQQARLVASNAGLENHFGRSVSLDGDTALVGAHRALADEVGRAYAFERSDGSWSEQAVLRASDGGSVDQFGASVSLDGDTALIAARLDEDPNGLDAGSAYVFTRSGGTWTESTKFWADDGDRSDRFGSAVALDGDRALLGAPWDEDPNGSKAGSAYAFEAECRLQIDLIPGTEFNVVDLQSEEPVPVEVLGTEEFDPVAHLEFESLRFGRPEVVENGGGAAAVAPCPTDDGLRVEFPLGDAGFEGDESVCKLVAETTDGERLSGTDEVQFASEFEDGDV